MHKIARIAALAITVSAWSARLSAADTKSVEAATHGTYVAAINSNDADTLMADLGLSVTGDWAFERSSYRSKDVDKKTGMVTTDKGKGTNIFRRGHDGKWRVAVDGWSSDIPISQ